MRVFAGLIALVAGTAAAAALPSSADPLGNLYSPALPADTSEARAGDQPSTGDAPDLAAADPALAPVMDRIEGSVELPAGARPLAGYARHYAWANRSKTKVTAIYLGWGTAGRKWVGFDDLPLVMDGGCGVIELVYDLPAGRADSITCNGGR